MIVFVWILICLVVLFIGIVTGGTLYRMGRGEGQGTGGEDMKLVTKRKVVTCEWRRLNPNNCPVRVTNEDGKDGLGPCRYYLYDGKCPQHGQIYEIDMTSDNSLKDDLAHQQKLVRVMSMEICRAWHGIPVQNKYLKEVLDWAEARVKEKEKKQ